MSGNTIGTIIGGAIGYFVPGFTLAYGMSIGGIAGSLLMPDEVGLQDQHGPRLQNLKTTTSTFGAPIANVYGTYRIGGNILWANDIKETKHVEEVEVGKGGSETYDVITYTYSVDMAIAFCEGPISGIRKIWCDSVLIYDFGSDKSLESLQASAQVSSQFTIYKGTSDQNPDWFLQSQNADTPAYRNIAYIVFKGFQLEKYGNRVPNITAEIVKVGDSNSSVYKLANYKITPDLPRYSKLNFEYWRSFTIGNTVDDFNSYYSSGEDGTIDYTGMIFSSSYYNKEHNGNSVYYNGYGSSNSFVNTFFEGVDQDHVVELTENKLFGYDLFFDDVNSPELITNIVASPIFYGVIAAFKGRSDNKNVSAYDISVWTNYGPAYGIALVAPNEYGSYLLYQYGYADGPELNYREVNVPYGLYGIDSSHTNMYKFSWIYNSGDFYLWKHYESDLGVYIPGVLSHKDYVYDNADEVYLITKSQLDTDRLFDVYIDDGLIYCLVQDSGADNNYPLIKVFNIIGTLVETITLNDKLPMDEIGDIQYTGISKGHFLIQVENRVVFLYLVGQVGIGVVYNYYFLIDLSTNGVIKLGRTTNQISPINWQYSITISNLINSGIGSYNFSNNTFKIMYTIEEYIVYFGIIDNSTVSLSSIVEDQLLKSGIEPINIETSEGDSVYVNGFHIQNVSSPRSAISILQSAYLFDVIEDDFKIKLITRGKPISKNITSLGANSESDLNISKSLETELPRKITLKYSNSDIDYQNGSQSVMRIDGDSDNNISFELPLVLTDSKAKQLAEILMESNWASKINFTFSIPFDPDLKVGDVFTITYEDVQYILRMIKIVFTSDNILQCDATIESTYESNAIGSDISEGFIDNTPYLQGNTELVVFNAHTLDNSAIYSSGVYYAASGNSAWKGCEVFKSNDIGETYSSIGTILNNTPIGETFGILADSGTSTWDLINNIKIKIDNADSLYSTSIESVLQGNNYIKIGNEILQFANVTDNSDGTYTLDTLLRGRRGTESFTGTHINREQVILLASLSNSDIQFVPSTINTERQYKGVSFGQYLEDAFVVKNTYDGTNLKPFSPSYFIGVRNGTDVNLSWHRRSRYVSGYMQNVELAEVSEEYVLEVYDDGDTLVNSYSNIEQSNYVYDVGLDGFGPSNELRMKIYQKSNVVGLGYASEYITIPAGDALWFYSTLTGVTISNGEKTFSTTSTLYDTVHVKTPIVTGEKVYVEVLLTGTVTTGNELLIGVDSDQLNQVETNRWIGYLTNEVSYFPLYNRLYKDGSYTTVSQTNPVTNDLMGLAIDYDNNQIHYYLNGVLQGSAIHANAFQNGTTYFGFTIRQVSAIATLKLTTAEQTYTPVGYTPIGD